MKALQFFKRHLIDGVLIVAIVLFVASIVTGYKPLFILTESMVPTLKVHQFALARRIDDTDALQIGDICSYKTDYGITITHRIIGKDDNAYIFKGDNNKTADNPVSPEKILYKVVWY